MKHHDENTYAMSIVYDDLVLSLYPVQNPGKASTVLPKLKTVAAVVGTISLTNAVYEVYKIFKSTAVKK